MEELKRESLDLKKIGRRLSIWRETNENLRRYVCYLHRKNENDCQLNCSQCKIDIDNHISQKELAVAFNVSVGTIANWESGRALPSLEDMLYYCKICKEELSELIIFEED